MTEAFLDPRGSLVSDTAQNSSPQAKGHLKGATPTPGITIRSLQFEFSRGFQLGPIDCSVPSAGVTVILGASGSGKSSLLKLIVGLLRPRSGCIDIAPELLRADGGPSASMVFQDYALYPHLTAEENIVLRFQVNRKQAAVRRALATELGQAFEVTHLWKRLPRQLSGGERQRIAILKALVSGMPLWLMDEPLSNLDAGIRYSVRAAIRHRQLETRSTLMLVTHDPSDALALGDRLIFLDQGKLMQTGCAEDVLRNPAALSVARGLRIPPPNEFQACVVSEDGSLWAQVDAQPSPGARIPLLRDAPLRAGQQLVLVADVHDTCVLTDVSPNTGLELKARPRLCEPGLAQDIWECETSLGTILCSVPSGSAMARGETVQVLIPYGAIRVFDTGTEQSLGDVISQPRQHRNTL